MAAFVASVLGGQPLLISGVTGPITVFNKTIYDIFVTNGSGGEGFDYHQFIGWVYLWGAILHWITAFTNGEWPIKLEGLPLNWHLYRYRSLAVYHAIPLRDLWLLCRLDLRPGEQAHGTGGQTRCSDHP